MRPLVIIAEASSKIGQSEQPKLILIGICIEGDAVQPAYVFDICVPQRASPFPETNNHLLLIWLPRSTARTPAPADFSPCVVLRRARQELRHTLGAIITEARADLAAGRNVRGLIPDLVAAKDDTGKRCAVCGWGCVMLQQGCISLMRLPCGSDSQYLRSSRWQASRQRLDRGCQVRNLAECLRWNMSKEMLPWAFTARPFVACTLPNSAA